MPRAKLLEAPYNPREIDDYALRKLVKSVEKFGLVDPPIWNKRTGYIVGGHQRLRAADIVFGTDQYEVDVVVIDVPEKREKQLNVVLNNRGLQGEYDNEKLAALLSEPDVKPDDFLFDPMDLAIQFEGTEYETIFSPDTQSEEASESIATIGDMAAAGKVAAAYEGAPRPADADAPNGRMENGEAIRNPEAHAALIAERDKMREKMAAANEARDPEFFLIVVCRDRSERESLAQVLGKDKDWKYIDAVELLHKLGAGEA